LYRNTEDKLVAGVLAGLADYYEQDVVFYRLAFCGTSDSNWFDAWSADILCCLDYYPRSTYYTASG